MNNNVQTNLTSNIMRIYLQITRKELRHGDIFHLHETHTIRYSEISTHGNDADIITQICLTEN